MKLMAPGKYDDRRQGWYDIRPVFAVSVTIITRKPAVFLDIYEYKWIYVEPE
jgi:hypothetical protein